MAKKIRSIMQDKEAGQCYLCRLLHGDYSIKSVRQEHHVMGGTANRRLSEKYGLKVWLDPDHHLYGPEAVHKNAKVAEILHREAQKAFEKAYPELDFLEIFGKNYLTENERNDSGEKYTLDQIVDAMVQADGVIILAIKHKDREWVRNVLKDYL